MASPPPKRDSTEPDRNRAFSPADSEQGSTSSGPWLPLVTQELGRSSSTASMTSIEEKEAQRRGTARRGEERKVTGGGTMAGSKNEKYRGEEGTAGDVVAGTPPAFGGPATDNEEKKADEHEEGDGFFTASSSAVGASSLDGEDDAEGEDDENNSKGGDGNDGKADAEQAGSAERSQTDRPAPTGTPQNDIAPTNTIAKANADTNESCRASSPARPQPPAPPGVPFVCLSAGLRRKADPTLLKSWVALSLTLDGRDKITKLCQYLSRLLGWYYETAAGRVAGNVLEIEGAADALLVRAKRFRSLQMKLTESRKAFRLGRSLVEVEKLRGMGWGPFLAYYLRRMVTVGEEGAAGDEGKGEGVGVPRPPTGAALRASSNVGWGPTTTFGEDGAADRSPPPPSPSTGEAGDKSKKKAGGPPPLLVRRASSNIGWGPATAAVAAAPSAASSRRSSFYRTVSQLGRRMYRPLTSQLSALAYGAGDGDGQTAAAPPSTPAWKLIGSTFKILGLMGFWWGDNAGFLRISGFLDDYSLDPDKRAGARALAKKRAGHFAARAYFFGAVSGLYVSLREALWHRNGRLRKAVDLVAGLEERMRRRESVKSKRLSWDMESEDEGEEEGTGSDHDDRGAERDLAAAKSALEDAKAKQFVLFLALLKSCCDVIVFSNNPGVDLHKRYRGKKMHEGFHSVCGLLSASTVIYNNFPNSSKGS